MNPPELNPFLEAAIEARKRAYAPHSRFQVGAALKIEDIAEPIVGCNVENASYGATLCAERVALFQAVARFGRHHRPEWMVLVTGNADPAVPCALCLQVMAELCSPEFTVFLANPLGVEKTLQLRELLPHPFTSFTPGS